MTTSLDGNAAARAAILARVRKALGSSRDLATADREAHAYVAAHAQGPRPAVPGDLVERFSMRARDMASTVDRVGSRAELPIAIARYLDSVKVPPALGSVMPRSGVCWPEFADLDWSGAGLSMEARVTMGEDRLGVTGCHCAIAETGTLVVLTGATTPTATVLLPDTHIAVVAADRIVPGMEDAFALIRTERGALPRAINMISGPSRTGDIEQTIVLGAHGPYRLHVIVVG